MSQVARLGPRLEYQLLDRLDGVEEALRALTRDRSEVARLEPWLPKKDMAAYLGVGRRWLEDRVAEGLPSRTLAGGRKFRVSEVEPWLRLRGYLEDE